MLIQTTRYFTDRATKASTKTVKSIDRRCTKLCDENWTDFSSLKHVVRNVKQQEEEHANHANEKEQILCLFHKPEQRMRVVPQQKSIEVFPNVQTEIV